MVNKLSQTIIDFNKLDKKNIKTIKIGDEIIGPDENGQVILNGTSGGTTTGGNTGGGTSQSQVPQLPSTVNLFSGSAVGNILLSGPSTNYDNVQDGLLITLSNLTLPTPTDLSDFALPQGTPNNPQNDILRFDLSSIGLKPIKIPKEKLVVNSSFDISDQLSQYIGKTVTSQYQNGVHGDWVISSSRKITSFEGTAIKVLSNTAISMNLIMHVTDFAGSDVSNAKFPIPVIQVNDYKN